MLKFYVVSVSRLCTLFSIGSETTTTATATAIAENIATTTNIGQIDSAEYDASCDHKWDNIP